MRAIPANIVRSVPIGARLVVADNSGAKILQVIGVRRYRGVKNRLAAAGIADIVIGTVKVGKPDIKKTVVNAVVIRVAKEYRRQDGTRIKFSDNACVVLKDLDEYLPKGTIIKGPVAKEVIKLYHSIGKIASIVV